MIEDLQKKFQETYEERKREELNRAIDEGKVADPFSTAFLVSLAVSAAISAASYGLSLLLAPKPPRQQRGKLSGSLQLQNSEQGLFISEFYGAGPTASLVSGSDPTYQNVANCSTGANGSIIKNAGGTNWNAGASHNTSISSGQDAFFQFVVGTGYATAGFTLDSSPTSGNTDFLFAIQWNPDGSISIKYNGTSVLGDVTHYVVGDTFRLELRSGRFRLFKGSAEIFPQGMMIPTPSYPLYMGIAMQIVGAGISNGKVQIGSIGETPNSGRGGVKTAGIIVWSSGIRKIVTVSQVPVQGGKGGGHTQTVENFTYKIDLGLMFGRGPLNLIREYGNADILIDQFTQSPNPSGIYNPGTGADPDYDPLVPPDPSIPYFAPIHRVDGDPTVDGDGVGTGTVQGGSSSFAIYPGNTDQQPDPIIEADIDGKYGTGSTPAFKNHFLLRHSDFDLSRWGGIVPNITAVLEHQTLKTIGPIWASMSERVGVLTANGDYDYTALTMPCRGLAIVGSPYRPAEVIGDSGIELSYNYFVTEAHDQLVGYVEGTEPSVTIPDTDIGWLEGDAELPDIAPELDSALVSEINLAREVHIKSIDPDMDWEPNTASSMRQITDGQSVELIEVQITQLADERRATAQRKLYRDYVAGTAYKFTLPWTYLYLHPGYKITITRAEGFTHVMRLTSISGGIGLLECEGFALEPETFNQPANGVFPPGYIPPQQIPAMTVGMILDVPLLRDGDETNNYGIGQYVIFTPRTGLNQNWQGASLQIFRRNEWQVVASSDVPGVTGTVVSTANLSDDPTVIDRIGSVVVDLYGTTATLSSVTEIDVRNGANMALMGDLVFHFVTATQDPDSPNRWTLTTLLKGVRGTEQHISDDFTGARFVLLNAAVKFFPMFIDEVNNEMNYKAVTVGQSLDDAATLAHVWTGQTLIPLPPVVKTFRFEDDSILVRPIHRPRIASGMRDYVGVPIAEEELIFQIQVRNAANSATVRSVRLRSSEVPPPQAVIWKLISAVKPAQVTLSNVGTALIAFDSVTPTQAVIYSQQKFKGDFTLSIQLSFDTLLPLVQITDTFYVAGATSGGNLYVQAEGDVTSQQLISSGDIVTIKASAGRVEYLFNSSTRPFKVSDSSIPVDQDLFVKIVTNNTQTFDQVAEKCQLTLQDLSLLHTAEMQTADGLTLGDPVHYRVAQESALVGVGPFTDVDVGGDPPFAPLVYASFKQNDATGSLPVAETGQTFSVPVNSASMGTSRYAINVTAASEHSATIDTGVADGIAMVQIQDNATTQGLVVRQDAVNYLLFRFWSTSWDLTDVTIGGAGSTLASGSLPHAVANGDWFSVEASGTSLKLRQKGELVTTQPSSVNLTATKHGVYIDSTSVRLKHFLFTTDTPATDSILITDPVPYRGLQRNAFGLADIPISGTYIVAGTVGPVEARFKTGKWKVIDESPSGGTFSGTLRNQPTGEGWLEVRFRDNRDVIFRVPFVAVGDVYAILGQSNAEGRIETAQFYTHPTLRLGVHDHGNAASTVQQWREAWDPTDTSELASPPYYNSVWPLLGTTMLARTNVPLRFISTAHGQTGLFGDGGTWQPGGVTYLEAKNAIIAANTGGLTGILWYGNESDGRGEPGTQAALEAALESLRSNLSADLGFGEIPMYIASLARINATGFTRSTVDLVRLAQTHVAVSNTHCKVGPQLYDLDTSVGGAADSIHISTAAHAAIEAARWDAALRGRRGPRFASATRVDATHIDVTFNIDSSFALMAANPPTTGWAVSGGPTAVSAAVRQSATVARLTVTGGNVVAGVTKVSWASFNDAVNQTFTDNSVEVLPVEPFVDQIVS